MSCEGYGKGNSAQVERNFRKPDASNQSVTGAQPLRLERIYSPELSAFFEGRIVVFRNMKRLAWILIAASAGFSQAPSMGDIMGRVAANQAKSVEARKQFVYRQQELVA